MYVQSARKKAFTIIEVLIVIAVISLVTIPLLVTYQTTRTTHALSSSAESLADNIRSAHIFARDAKDRKNWGVKNIDKHHYEIYSEVGDTHTSEKVYTLENAVNFAKDFDVVFKIGTGETDNDITIELVAANNQKENIQVYKTGIAETVPI